MPAITPRSLTPNESGLLYLAAASISDDRCREELLGQIAGLRVIGGLPLYVDFEVTTSVDRTCLPGRNNPIEGTAFNAAGGVVGGILVWIKDGALHSLEYFTYEDTEPRDDVSAVRLGTARMTLGNTD